MMGSERDRTMSDMTAHVAIGLFTAAVVVVMCWLLFL